MHAIEKILARHAGKASITTGEIITAKIDFAEVNDLYPQTLISFEEMDGKKVWDKDKVAFAFDHFAPPSTIKMAQIHKTMRAFRDANGLTHHFDINAGVCHQVMAEAGVIYPGSIIVATDSHTTTHGAFGALGTGVGATDMATILISGELWFRVPEIVEMRIEGTPQKGVYPKDVVLYLLGKVRANGAVYKAVEFTGSYIEQLDVAGRMVICNMALEMGAKTAYMQPNQSVLDFVSARAEKPFEVEYTDSGYQFAESLVFDISEIGPQVAAPHSVDNVFPIENFKEVKINQGFVGTCTGGRVTDIMTAAAILKGKRIADGVRLLVIPASTEVMNECLRLGILQDCIAAGATICTPGCGPCLSAHEGVLAEGEVCITASNRNFPGRMGSNKAQIYLASPAAVAASALTGTITDPRGFL